MFKFSCCCFRCLIYVEQVTNQGDRNWTTTDSKATRTLDPGTGFSTRTFSTPSPSPTPTPEGPWTSTSRAGRATGRGKIRFKQDSLCWNFASRLGSNFKVYFYTTLELTCEISLTSIFSLIDWSTFQRKAKF